MLDIPPLFSFVDLAQKATTSSYIYSMQMSETLAEITSRIAAFILFTPAGLADAAYHSLMGTAYLIKGESAAASAHFQKISFVTRMIFIGSIGGLIQPLHYLTWFQQEEISDRRELDYLPISKRFYISRGIGNNLCEHPNYYAIVRRAFDAIFDVKYLPIRENWPHADLTLIKKSALKSHKFQDLDALFNFAFTDLKKGTCLGQTKLLQAEIIKRGASIPEGEIDSILKGNIKRIFYHQMCGTLSPGLTWKPWRDFWRKSGLWSSFSKSVFPPKEIAENSTESKPLNMKKCDFDQFQQAATELTNSNSILFGNITYLSLVPLSGHSAFYQIDNKMKRYTLYDSNKGVFSFDSVDSLIEGMWASARSYNNRMKLNNFSFSVVKLQHKIALEVRFEAAEEGTTVHAV